MTGERSNLERSRTRWSPTLRGHRDEQTVYLCGTGSDQNEGGGAPRWDAHRRGRRRTRTDQLVRRGELLAATFVVNLEGRLRIADCHSEHVACSGGGDVLAAGEMLFSIDGLDVSVEQVSNQSTGYCPEPESWVAVGRALDSAGIAHPGVFTTACEFRRCESCGERNIVKDRWFYCDICGAKLPDHWNFG